MSSSNLAVRMDNTATDVLSHPPRDSLPIVAGPGEPPDVPANVLRMRDRFVAEERAAGIVRA